MEKYDMLQQDIKIHFRLNIKLKSKENGEKTYKSNLLLLLLVAVVEAEERGDLQLKRTQDLGKTFTTIHEDIYSFGYIGTFLFFSVMEDTVR